MTRRPAEAGFTLLEILVALVVLGFLLLGLGEGVRFGVHAWDTEARLLGRHADMDAVERVLRAMIAGADPGGVDDELPFRGTPHTLLLATRLPMSTTEVAGLREAEVSLGVDAQHRFVLRWTPHPHAQRLTPMPPPHQTVLLEDVESVTFGYERAPAEGTGWTDIWQGAPTLPRLVRITIAFPKDDPRHWPAIVAAPMLTRAEQ